MARGSESIFRVAPETGILAALLLLVVPLRWVCAWFAAALWHELFHCFALRLCGRSIHGVCIGINGAEIRTDNLSDLDTLLCALAGPAGGLLLLLLSGVFPCLAVCALLQSVFNLLPVYPLDGGRALRGFTGLLFSERWANGICTAAERIVLAGAVCFGLVSSFFWKLGILPVVLTVFFMVHLKKIKRPCKSMLHRVQ